MVDTTLFGHLHKKDDDAIGGSNLELLISQEFYEAGKFKNKQLPNFAKQEDLIRVRLTIFMVFSSLTSFILFRAIKIRTDSSK